MISILCPTRGRPTNVLRLVESAFETADVPGKIEFVFYIDEDDESAEETRSLIATYLSAKHVAIKVVNGPRMVMSQYWNECYVNAAGPIFMQCGDDIIFRSDSWDNQVLDIFDSYPNGILFAHGRDGVHDAGFGTHGFLHRRWAESVGYFLPPYFSCDWSDTWLNEVANIIGRRVFLPHVFTEHMHPNFGKAPLDETHRERLERGARDNPGLLYQQLAHERAEDAVKLRAAIAAYTVSKG
jgi:hypothetical protein